MISGEQNRVSNHARQQYNASQNTIDSEHQFASVKYKQLKFNIGKLYPELYNKYKFCNINTANYMQLFDIYPTKNKNFLIIPKNDRSQQRKIYLINQKSQVINQHKLVRHIYPLFEIVSSSKLLIISQKVDNQYFWVWDFIKNQLIGDELKDRTNEFKYRCTYVFPASQLLCVVYSNINLQYKVCYRSYFPQLDKFYRQYILDYAYQYIPQNPLTFDSHSKLILMKCQNINKTEFIFKCSICDLNGWQTHVNKFVPGDYFKDFLQIKYSFQNVAQIDNDTIFVQFLMEMKNQSQKVQYFNFLLSWKYKIKDYIGKIKKGKKINGKYNYVQRIVLSTNAFSSYKNSMSQRRRAIIIHPRTLQSIEKLQIGDNTKKNTEKHKIRIKQLFPKYNPKMRICQYEGQQISQTDQNKQQISVNLQIHTIYPELLQKLD